MVLPFYTQTHDAEAGDAGDDAEADDDAGDGDDVDDDADAGVAWW